MIELHPLCTLFPRLPDAEFASLVADIKANGLRHPITLHAGMILDGGNRYRACLDAGVEPAFDEFVGKNIASFVISANLHRRHLSPGQQAAIVASAQDWAKAQTVGNPQFGNVTGLETVAARRAVSGASDKTQRDADKVAKASPELAKKVAHGEKTLPDAVAEVTGKPKRQPEPTRDEELESARQRAAEMEAQARETLEDNMSMAAVFESNDQVSAALAEAKRYRELNRVLEERVRGLMGELNEAKRLVKYWKKQAEACKQT